MRKQVFFKLICLITASAFTQAGLSLSGEEVSLEFPQSHDFSISASSSTFAMGDCLSYANSENIWLNVSKTIGEKALEVEKFISFDGVKQWKLVHFEDFAQPTGWTDNSNSQCAGVVMLGGYCLFSSQEVSKTFTGLPGHSAVKVVGNFHFIDAWIGETGYLKIKVQGQSQFVWTEGYKAGQAGDGKNLCGAHHAEGKFFSGFEIVVPHNEEQLELTFGATLEEDPCDESWGVSALQIFTR